MLPSNIPCYPEVCREEGCGTETPPEIDKGLGIREATGWGWGRGRRRGGGAGCPREVQEGLRSGETEEVVKSYRRCQGRVSAPSPHPPRIGWGWESAPSGCFLAGLGVFNINSNDCGRKIIGLSQIRRG